jgi:hypothetical protein
VAAADEGVPVTGRHPHVHPTPSPSVSPASGVHLGSLHVPGGLLEGAVGVAVLFILYWLLSSHRIRGHLRRAGICVGVAAVLSAIGVGYVDHAYHVKLAASSKAGRMPAIETLAFTWGFGVLVLAVVLFTVATMVVRRRGGGLGLNLGSRRRGRGTSFPPLGGGGLGGLGGWGPE